MRMRTLDPTVPPPVVAAARSDAALVDLAVHLATHPIPATGSRPATDPQLVFDPRAPVPGPPTGRVAEGTQAVLGLSTGPAGRPLAVPLLVTSEVEAWLLEWPAGLVTAVHDHGGAEAVTVVEGALSEECLDPTIWTTGRRTTWRAGASTLFPAGHVHLLGAAGGRPAVAVHAWTVAARSADRGAGRSAQAAGRGPAGGRGPGGGGGAAVQARVGRGRGGACRAGQPAHGPLDLGHIRDGVAV
jgi:quercetin dioxygenase-like cupin family protein